MGRSGLTQTNLAHFTSVLALTWIQEVKKEIVGLQTRKRSNKSDSLGKSATLCIS